MARFLFVQQIVLNPQTRNPKFPMEQRDRFLVRKLALVLVIKLAVLAGLWWGFVRDQRVAVTTDRATAQILGTRPTPAPMTSTTQE